MNTPSTSNSGCLKALLLVGLVGLFLGWGANQWMVWVLGNQAEQWVPAPLPKLLPRHAQAKPAGPVEFAPGIIEEQFLPAAETPNSDASDEARAPSERDSPWKASRPAPSKDAASADQKAAKSQPEKKREPASKPAAPIRVFTADREALKTQFKKPSDLYAHGHYLPNEVDGVRRGVRFAAVAPGGIFARLGFQRGDVVLSVNGAQLNTQSDVLANFERMRKVEVLNMRLERDGRPLKHRFIIK